MAVELVGAERGQFQFLFPDDPRWLDFVRSTPDGGVFHHPAWISLVAETYGYQPFLSVLMDDARIVAGIPLMVVAGPTGRRRWVALPFADHCVPLAGNPNDLRALTEALERASREAGVRTVEVRGELPGAAGDSSDAVVHLLNLGPDAGALFRRFKRTQVQQCIEKAEREGVRVRRSTELADVTDTFYRLHVQTRRRLGVPVQPKRFFELLWHHLIEADLGFVAVAEHDNRPISAAVFLTWKTRVTYKYSASDPAFWQLRPNNLVLWDAIRWGCENGFETLDFGRTELDNAGLRSFKRGWNSQEVPLVYSTLGELRTGAGAGVLRGALSRVIRRSPPWVCRAVGEVLYRYAG